MKEANDNADVYPEEYDDDVFNSSNNTRPYSYPDSASLQSPASSDGNVKYFSVESALSKKSNSSSSSPHEVDKMKHLQRIGSAAFVGDSKMISELNGPDQTTKSKLQSSPSNSLLMGGRGKAGGRFNRQYSPAHISSSTSTIETSSINIVENSEEIKKIDNNLQPKSDLDSNGANQYHSISTSIQTTDNNNTTTVFNFSEFKDTNNSKIDIISEPVDHQENNNVNKAIVENNDIGSQSKNTNAVGIGCSQKKWKISPSSYIPSKSPSIVPRIQSFNSNNILKTMSPQSSSNILTTSSLDSESTTTAGTNNNTTFSSNSHVHAATAIINNSLSVKDRIKKFEKLKK